MPSFSEKYGAYGRNDALAHFGLQKVAAPPPSLGQRTYDHLKSTLVGNPTEVFKQLREGKLYEPEGLGRRAFAAPDWQSKILNYGLPAALTGLSLLAPPEVRGSAVGSSVGGLVGGMIGAPLGLLGSFGGSVLAGGLGEHVGSLFNKKTAPPEKDVSGVGNVSHSGKAAPLSSTMSQVTERPAY